MGEFLARLFDTTGFPARWNCGATWGREPFVGWLHVVSDLLIFGAYSAIPLVLGYFLARRRDLPFPRIFLLFCAFIFACGSTHLIEAGLFWWPAYRFSGAVKAFTAIVSWTTVVALLPVLPKALALRSPRQLEDEVAERTRALRASEERFRLLAESVPDIVFTADAALGLTYVSSRFSELTGVATAEALGHGWREDIHPDDRDRVRLVFGQAVGAGERCEVEFRIRTQDGSFRWMVGRASPVRERDGGIERWFGTLTDIDDLKRAEERIRDREQRLRLALHAGRMGTWDWDARTGTATWDEVQYSVFGLEPTSPTVSQERFFQSVHPDDRAALRAAVEDVLRTGRDYDHRFRIVRPDGAIRWIAGEGQLTRDADGRPVRLTGINYDVTDRHMTELRLRERTEKLAAVLNHVADGVVVCDDASRLRAINPAVMRMYGLATADDAREFFERPSVRRAGMRVLDASDREIPFADWPASRMMRGEGFRDLEATLRDGATGRSWTGIFSGVTVAHEVGAPSLFVMTVRDMSDHKRQERELHAPRAAADAANRAKSEFLANMSHEIRTPMTAILGYADILERTLALPDDRQHVRTIRRNGEHLLEIVNDILDLSKIEAGRFELHPRPCRPAELVDEILALMRVRAREKGLSLTAECAGDLPERILTDPVRLRQILINLVGNAIKFTESGGVRLVVRTLDGEAPPTLEVAVIDTGCGIDPELRRRLFEPFAQGPLRHAGGTGLGLSISRRLAELLGGTVVVDEGRGPGSTFRARVATGPLDGVPRIRPEFVPPAEDVPSAPDVPTERLDGRRILVVDDRHDIRSITRQILEDAGADVHVAGDGLEALRSVRAADLSGSPFDAVVMDMQMPVLDGYETTQRLRDEGFDRPVVALTAAAMRGDRDRCLEAGCDDYLPKPIDGPMLVARLADWTRPAPLDRRHRPAEPSASTGRRILLVDDSVDACRALAELLRMDGYRVSAVHDGGTALDAFRAERPEIVLLDIELPDRNGYEVLGDLRSAVPSDSEPPTFVALSGHADATRSLEAGFDAHLLKPVDWRSLEDLLA